MTIDYIPGTTSNLVGDPSEGGAFSSGNKQELSGANTAAANASTSATAAFASATAANLSKESAASSESNAQSYKTLAETAATTATTKASEASTSATNAAASYDSFDDRYLGAKNSAPSADNDGNALIVGALYFNTTSNTMNVWNGSAWAIAAVDGSTILLKAQNLADLPSVSTARTNLGLGTMALETATDYATLAGATFTGDVTAPEFIGVLQGETVFKAKAGEALSKGDAVYVSGISGNTPVVSKADANGASTFPAFGLAAATTSNNGTLDVITAGQLKNFDTSGFSLGDTLYLSTTPGVLTATPPTGEGSVIQNMGKVEREHASVGSILVVGAGRTAATPNLNDGNVFIGNSSNKAVTGSFNTLADARIANNIIDEDSFSTNSATRAPSQQSVKQYVADQTANINAPTINTPDINGGTIDGAVIGEATPAAGTFTAVTANNLKASSSAPYLYSLDTDVADSELRVGCFGVGVAYRARGGTSDFGAHQFTRFNGTDTHTVLSTNVGGDFLLHTDDGTANTKYNASTGNLRIGSNSNSASKLKVDGEISSTNLTVDDKVRIGTGGSAGTYAADLEFRRQGNAKSIFTADCSGTTLDVTSVQNDASPIEVGDLFFGSNAEIQPNTFITALGTGTGGTGTYTISTTASFTGVSGLVVAPATDNRIRFTSTDTFVHQGQPIGSIDFVSSDTTSSGTKAFIVAGHQEQAPSTYIAFGTNNNTDGTEAQEVARFDENGKLLIGALTTNDTLDHIELRDTGEIRSASLATGTITTTGSNSSPLTVNRNNSHGTMIDLQANGVTKTVIGYNSNGEAFLRSDLGGFRFSQAGLRPTINGFDGNDNAADLGTLSNKFKDLYLGGNANVSGTLASGVSTFTKSGGSGTIAEFYNDTTRVAFIKDRSEVVSSLVLDTRTNGVGISATVNALIPTDLNGNPNSNATNLGNLNNKWKDIVIGGGVYLGGDTAAANKLEDYEEGTWTPVFRDEVTGGNVASGQAFNGSYTRIGNQCTLHMRVINIDPDTDVTGTNNVYITGLPFAASDVSSNYRYVGSMESTRISYSGSIQPRITENTNYMVISKTNQSGSTAALLWDDITDAQADMYVSITYTV